MNTQPIVSTANEPSGIAELDIPRRLLFIAPRGFAKSTLCSVVFPLWLAAFGHKKDIFLVSATISLAKEQLRKIRKELEGNSRLINDFGELRSEKWTEEELELKNGTIIRAKGRGFQIRGFRPDIIICDDLEDEEMMYSASQREKLHEWFFRTLLPSLKPDQYLIYVGTMLHHQSLMSELKKKSEVKTWEWSALKDGKSIWEELWPTARLNALRKEIGEYAFLAEYQNQPVSFQDAPVKLEMLNNVSVEGNVVAIAITLDPAISLKETSDPRAIVATGRFVNGEDIGFKTLQCSAGHWGVEEQVNRFLDTYVSFRDAYPQAVIIPVVEQVAFQRVLYDLITKEAKKRGIIISVREAKLAGLTPGGSEKGAPKDKFTRLLSVVHLFEQRRVQVDQRELVEQLISFPSGDHDDMVDSLVYGLRELMTLPHSGIFPKKELLKTGPAKESFVVEEIRPGIFVAQAGPPLPPQHSRIKTFHG